MTNTEASHRADHAGVWIPPPLIYLVLFGLGVVLQRLMPLALPPAFPARAVAMLCLACYLLLFGWSYALFRRAQTSMVPVKPSTALVMRGPYRLTRNPMYVSLVCLYLAVALWFGVSWALVFVPLVILAVQHLAITREEHYLEQKFGDAYRRYRAQVRRWI
ncbi:MAG: isoprenylcysteine carboxylmethyltransferase family protein [Chloroflexales bacterium]|nr:isoprenylcysteine carboxylmethyltransferase family protein [Chloroflexales bacterium]